MKLKSHVHILILILILGIFLRTYGLDSKSMWVDEALRIAPVERAHELGFSTLFGNVETLGVHPPLHHVFLYFWSFLGTSDFTLKFLSVLLGAATILVSYALAKKLFGIKVGVVASFLVAISPFNIAYSQEICQYVLFGLLSIIAFYFLTEFLGIGSKNVKNKNISLFFFTLFSIMSVYTHYYAFFLLIAENLFVFLFWKKYLKILKKWILSQIIIVLAFAPWANVMLTWVGHTGSAEYSTDLLLVLKTFPIFSFGSTIPQNILLVAVGCIIFAFIFLLGVLLEKDIRKIVLLAFVAIIPIIIAYALSFGAVRIFAARYFLPSSLFFLMVVANGITKIKNKNIFSAIIVSIVLLSSLSLGNYYFNEAYAKEDYRGAAGYVMANEKQGDVIMCFTYAIEIPFDRYYSGPAETFGIPKSFNWNDGLRQSDVFNVSDTKIIKDIIKNHKRVWIVLSHDYGRGSDTILSYMNETYKFVEKEEFSRNVRVYLYEVRYGGNI